MSHSIKTKHSTGNTWEHDLWSGSYYSINLSIELLLAEWVWDPWTMKPKHFAVLSVEFGDIVQVIQCHLHVPWSQPGWTKRGQSRNLQVISLDGEILKLQSIYYLSSNSWPWRIAGKAVHPQSPFVFLHAWPEKWHNLVVVSNSILAGWWLIIGVIGSLGLLQIDKRYESSTHSQYPSAIPHLRPFGCYPYSCHLRKATRQR